MSQIQLVCQGLVGFHRLQKFQLPEAFISRISLVRLEEGVSKIIPEILQNRLAQGKRLEIACMVQSLDKRAPALPEQMVGVRLLPDGEAGATDAVAQTGIPGRLSSRRRGLANDPTAPYLSGHVRGTAPMVSGIPDPPLIARADKGAVTIARSGLTRREH